MIKYHEETILKNSDLSRDLDLVGDKINDIISRGYKIDSINFIPSIEAYNYDRKHFYSSAYSVLFHEEI